MKTLIVGEAPARGRDNDPPFSSRSGQRISEMLGQPIHDIFDVANLLDYWPGSESKGSRFPVREASVWAEFLVRNDKHERIILAGGRVAKAFKTRPELKVLEWASLWKYTLMPVPDARRAVMVAILPHPSGVNRWYNDPDNRAAAERFLKREAARNG